MTIPVNAAVTAPTKPVEPANPPLIVDKEHRRWRYAELSIGLRGYVRSLDAEPPAGEPWIAWDGGKIHLELWNQVCAFFEWSQDKFKSEVQVRLYYNPKTRKWAVWAYPQQPNGMTTKELPDHADYALQRKQFGADWTYFGTIHHHCTSPAFQSGTDKANETAQDGIHITVGDITKSEYSIRGRIQLMSREYVCTWTNWFDAPNVSEMLPMKIRTYALEYYLKNPPGRDVAFPEQWKTNCIPQLTTSWQGTGIGQTTHGAAGTSHYARIPVVMNLRSQFTADELQFMLVCLRLMSSTTPVTQHNRADYLLFEAQTANDPGDNKFVHSIWAAASAYKLTKSRVDQLFDVWDFRVVVDELKIAEQPDAAPTEKKADAIAPAEAPAQVK